MNLLRWLLGKKLHSNVKRNTYPLWYVYTNTDIIHESHWEVTGVTSLPAFFRALSRLAPNNSILCLEGGVWPARVQNVFDAISLNMELEPRPGYEGYYFSITEEHMAKLAEVAENSAESEIAIHLFVLFGDEKGILEWYDLPNDPIHISETIEQQSVSHFAEAIGASYRRIWLSDDCTPIDV